MLLIVRYTSTVPHADIALAVISMYSSCWILYATKPCGQRHS